MPSAGARLRHFTRSAPIALGLLLATSDLRAQPTADEKQQATALFREAKALLEAGAVAEACRKLELSQRLDPGTGTLLNLAVCHEKEGRLATAAAEFRDALALARAAGRTDRVDLATQHLAALEPRLSKLVIIVSPQTDRPGLEVRRDGVVVAKAAWGTAIAIDPGEHIVEASAPNEPTWRVRVTAPSEGEVLSIEVPALAPAAPPAAAAPQVGPRIDVVAAPSATAEAVPGGPARGLSGRRVSALALGGAGIVSTGIGAYFGLLAISKKNDAEAECPNRNCRSAGATLSAQAVTAADVSTVTVIVGLSAIGAGVMLWLTDRSWESRSSVGVRPSVGAGRAGVDVVGTF